MSVEPGVRPVAPLMRLLLLAGGLFVLGAGFQLYVLAERTDRYFAWTIASPLAAAFIGSFYWSAAVIALGSARRREWANARVGVPGITVFVALTGVETLIHLKVFHLHETGLPLFAAWVWLGVYALEPPVLAAAWTQQLRTRGGDPPRTRPLPVWLQWVLGAETVGLLAVGTALFLSPVRAGEAWPWALTPLAARAMASWMVGLGLAAAMAVRENDRWRVRPAFWGVVVLTLLQFAALLRFGDEIAWGRPSAWVYVGMLAAGLITGVAGLAGGRKAPA